MTPKLAKRVRMDGERIIKLSGQGSVFIRCLEPLEEEDKDEEDELLMKPPYAQCTDILSENPVGTSSSSSQQPLRESASLDLAEQLLPTNEEMPFFPGIWNDQLVDDNENVVIGNDIAVPTTLPNDNEVPTKIIRVHRSLIREDMLENFSEPSILQVNLNAIIINQHGHEEAGQGSGVLREVFSLFWKECYKSHMLGETERVPYIRHDFDRKKWEAVGRILVKGYTESQYLPHKISKAFLAACLFGEGSVTCGMLQDSFKRYVSISEASVIEGCLTNSIQCDSEEVLDFLSAFDCKWRVTSENVVEIIREVAHKEIVQKPQYVADCWQPIVSRLKIYFPDVRSLDELYSSIVPTNVKVIALLKASPVTAADGESLAHLKRFIRGLDEAKLATFLRFTTASDVFVTDTLTISFTDNEGLQRRPAAHTCSFTLEVPSTYSSFCKLREEFMSILNSDGWEMNIV